jgi:hypothetical protein
LRPTLRAVSQAECKTSEPKTHNQQQQVDSDFRREISPDPKARTYLPRASANTRERERPAATASEGVRCVYINKPPKPREFPVLSPRLSSSSSSSPAARYAPARTLRAPRVSRSSLPACVVRGGFHSPPPLRSSLSSSSARVSRAVTPPELQPASPARPMRAAVNSAARSA